MALEVDVQGAKYPVTIDPVAQDAYIKGSVAASSLRFGAIIALSGDLLVVGVPLEGTNASGVGVIPQATFASASFGTGGVYIFARVNGQWRQEVFIKANAPGTGDEFGSSVAVSGQTVVVGARNEDGGIAGINGNQLDNGASGSGAAYVYVRQAGVWSLQAYLKASNVGIGDLFGTSVAISGDTIVVGAPGEDGAGFDSGAAYVFTRSGTTWTQQAYVKAPDVSFGFGTTVAISGDQVAIGAPNRGVGGAVYPFIRTGGAWTPQAILTASNVGSGDRFGAALALDGSTLVVGAPSEDSGSAGVNLNQTNDSAFDAGAAYVFTRAGEAWSQAAYLKASNPGSDDRFGTSVCVSGTNVVVGSPGEDGGSGGINGTQVDNSRTDSGAAYLFSRSTAWQQIAYIKAPSPVSSENLGFACGFSGATLALGIPDEDSSTTGINSVPNGICCEQGAVRTFRLQLTTEDRLGVYNAGTWTLDLNGNGFDDGLAVDRVVSFTLGSSAEIPLKGDWNGDGNDDIAVYLNGTWLIDANGNGVWDGPAVYKLIYFGGPGYQPFVGDWNGDGKSDIAVHLDGTWLIDRNGNLQWDGPAADTILFFGGPGYTPYIGKWGSSSVSSIAVHKDGTWIIDRNANFNWDGPAIDGLLFFGGPGYTPVLGDWNGDGTTDLGAYLNGTWLLDANGSFTWDAGDRMPLFGGTGFVPVVGDWDNSGTTNIGAFALGAWVLDFNGNGVWEGATVDRVTLFGHSSATPIPGRWR